MNILKSLTLACALFMITACGAKPNKMIEQTILTCAKASDNSDVTALNLHLDDHFRVVMNQLFGSKTVSVLPKAAYLEKIKNKEFGGTKRTTKIISITENGKTAQGKVRYESEKMTFVSLLTLVQHADGSWKIISDLPTVEQ